jgi:hypothetical protein
MQNNIANEINICRTLLKKLRKSHHQNLPPGVMRRLKKIEKILDSRGSNLSLNTVLNLIKILTEVLRTLGDLAYYINQGTLCFNLEKLSSSYV